MPSRFPIAALALLLVACPSESADTTPPIEPKDTTPEEPAKPDRPALTIEYLREHTRLLSTDEFGGRLPGSEGARKTVEHIVAQMEAIGLEPAGVDGGWAQTVRMRGVTVDQAATQIEIGSGKGQAMSMPFGTNWVGSSFAAGTEQILDAEL